MLFPRSLGDAAKQLESVGQGSESWDGKDTSMGECVGLNRFVQLLAVSESAEYGGDKVCECDQKREHLQAFGISAQRSSKPKAEFEILSVTKSLFTLHA